MAPQGAVEEHRGREQHERAGVHGGPHGRMHLRREREDAVREAGSHVLPLGVDPGLVHNSEADVALPVVEEAGVEHVHDTLAVAAQRQQQRAERGGGDVGEDSRERGACMHGVRRGGCTAALEHCR